MFKNEKRGHGIYTTLYMVSLSTAANAVHQHLPTALPEGSIAPQICTAVPEFKETPIYVRGSVGGQTDIALRGWAADPEIMNS